MGAVEGGAALLMFVANTDDASMLGGGAEGETGPGTPAGPQPPYDRIVGSATCRFTNKTTLLNK